jgi:hypothetical protein
MTIKILEKSIFEKRQKPKGHRTYSRMTPKGKVSQVKEKPYARAKPTIAWGLQNIKTGKIEITFDNKDDAIYNILYDERGDRIGKPTEKVVKAVITESPVITGYWGIVNTSGKIDQSTTPNKSSAQTGMFDGERVVPVNIKIWKKN